MIDVSDERQRGAIMRYVRENIVQLRRYDTPSNSLATETYNTLSNTP